MPTKLMQFQRDGVDRVHDLDGRALIADECGLGKTIQALAYLKESGARPAVIVCPAGMKLHWQREAEKHYKLKTVILSGSVAKGTKTLKQSRVFIINYDILHGWLWFLRSLSPQVVIGDESHFCQSMKARRTRAFATLCRGVQHVLCLSGTPLTNKPWELFPVLNILWPTVFHSPFSFGHKFCNATRVFGHWKFDGAKHLVTLHRQLHKLGMIRRTKKEVLGQLPPIRRIVQVLEIEDRKQYERAEADFITWLSEIDLARAKRAMLDVRTKFGYLKRLVAQLKLKYVKEWVDNFLEESDGKLLLGCLHRSIISELADRYHGLCTVIHGGKSAKQRQDAEDTFRRNKGCRILVGQIQAAGVGLNLPEANTVALAEFPWTPGAVQQFIARCHRLSSTGQVNAYFLVAVGTIEESLLKILEKKSRNLSKVLDGKATKEGSLDVFAELQRILLRESRD